MDSEKQHKVYSFINTIKLATVATVSPAIEPEASLIAISETENLEIIFGTLVNTRKYTNLGHNSKVAFVIGSDRKVVQFQGMARELKDGEAEKFQAIHVAKHPTSEKYLTHPDERYFIVTPTWIRYTDHTIDPQEEFEINF